MKVVIVGGHLSPALSVIDALSPKDEVVFLGRKYALEGNTTPSLEYQEITRRGIEFRHITTARVQRALTKHTLPSLAKLPYGLYQAVTNLRQIKPDVVLSFGGYLSVPIGYAARFLGIPLVIHEQTLESGLANKLVGKIADKICISWESSYPFFPRKNTVLTGNPLKKFSDSTMPYTFSKKDAELPLLYVTGGSTGSHAINELIKESLPSLLSHFRVIHQTGVAKEYNDFETLTKIKTGLGKEEQSRYIIEKYVSPNIVGAIFSEASLVVSRSGINTITELLYFGKPALLIPLPHGQRGEQLKNAQFLEKAGLARILPQHMATPEVLMSTLSDMEKKHESFEEQGKAARKLIHMDASQRIVDTLYVVKKKSS